MSLKDKVKIKQVNTNSVGTFVAKENNVAAGRLYYRWAASKALVIEHTEVNPECKGKGVGKKLVMEVVNYARQNKITIVPLCIFAKALFDKTPDISDVLQ